MTPNRAPRAHEDSALQDRRRHVEERILVDRLVSRQGVSREEASFLVEQHREGKRPAIDPALMEGLDEL